MSIETFIRAMPKVELRVRLEGAYRKETLMLIAEQNDIPETTKNYQQWFKLLENPDYTKLDELVRVLTGWFRHPDDLTRVVYDLGVALAKQNVKYVEVAINPISHMLPGMSFDEFMDALNDGRNRAQRGWGIRMGWILIVPREEPRRADDVVRWATSVTGKKGGVIALGLSGREEVQPAGQFERPFTNAQKKDVFCVVQAGDSLQGEGIIAAIQHLNPRRIIDGRGAADAPDVLNLLVEKDIALDISLARALCHGWSQSYAAYPLRHLFDADVKVTLNTDMPAFYKSSLTDEYLAAVQHCGLTIEDLEQIALNAILYSFLPEDEKAIMAAEFMQEYERLRAEHIVPQTT